MPGQKVQGAESPFPEEHEEDMQPATPDLKGKRTGPYRKFIYWLTPEDTARLRENLTVQGIKVKAAKGVVCTPFDSFNRISTVAPEVWDDTCKRAGAWYHTSDKDGLHAVVSAAALPGYEDRLASVVTESDFAPPRLADKEDKRALLEDPMLKARMPPAWLNVLPREEAIYLRWAHRMGSEESHFNALFLTHTANHANFIHPRCFVEEAGRIVPYSIDRTAHLCSCCLEIYQILGGAYPVKQVAPCPGAALFARLQPDRYLLVRSGAAVADD
ncbi:conserved hypothetical protein [uncultured Desulfatiglans sp.]|nr:conserved hypothetical protein [uncultured Desulfatiglans sp.]